MSGFRKISPWLCTISLLLVEQVAHHGLQANEHGSNLKSDISRQDRPHQQIVSKTSSRVPRKTSSPAPVTLHVIGLFAMSGPYPAGQSYLPAALLAVKHINEDPSILPNYRLQINAYDTNCSEARGLDAFYKEVYNPNRTSIMALGGTCSHVTEATAAVSNLWKMLQISYSAVSPHLSNQDLFPAFFRVMTPEQNRTHARVELLRVFNWTRVLVIYRDFKLFSSLFEEVQRDLQNEGFEVKDEMLITNSDLKLKVETLRKKDARIVLGSFYEDEARRVMCAVYDSDTGPPEKAWYKKMVWVLPSFFDRYWMNFTGEDPNCTPHKIRQVVGQYFTIGSAPVSGDPEYKAVRGMSPLRYKELYSGQNLYEAVKDDIPKEYRHMFGPDSTYFNRDWLLYAEHRSPEAYDAVWAIAYALNDTLTTLLKYDPNSGLGDYSYHNETFFQLMKSHMQNVKFSALSGPFSFNERGERTPGILISRFLNDDNLTFIDIGRCTLPPRGTKWNCSIEEEKIIWENGKVPVDGVLTVNQVVRIDGRIKFCFWFLACSGILLTLALLVFNIMSRRHKIIKMSSPRINNIILSGCLIAYCSVLIIEPAGGESTGTCVLHTFLLALSFSIGFGAVFAKTWRVYTIFTHGHRMRNTRMIKDSSLFAIIMALVLLNCIILTVWALVSPQSPHLVNFGTPVASSDEDLMIQEQFLRCDSKYGMHFAGTLNAIQGLVILFGTFLAVQTRKVSLPELNDSKWIALCIYNVVVLAPISVVVVLATDSKPEVNYALRVAMLLLITSVTECLIFVPKIISYRRFNRTKSLKSNPKERSSDHVHRVLGAPPTMTDSSCPPTLLQNDGPAVSFSSQTQCVTSISNSSKTPYSFDTPRSTIYETKEGAISEIPLPHLEEFSASSCDLSKVSGMGRSLSDSNLSFTQGDPKISNLPGGSRSTDVEINIVDGDCETQTGDKNVSELTAKVKDDVDFQSNVGFKASERERRTGMPKKSQS
ncbi:gamma-aminobutyric acid type B receptor subunit 2 [Aplysia californica]|uniref:Gamma-aminobutyric acid type B receptor subunit 2 n=1 Tax=Aplysia californica TaxID=6500 RepID=A0ABM0K8B7_APLCA|nr:gamma-aminobutyric acid type B receptor subunit 2 [Aplysia californica]